MLLPLRFAIIISFYLLLLLFLRLFLDNHRWNASHEVIDQRNVSIQLKLFSKSLFLSAYFKYDIGMQFIENSWMVRISNRSMVLARGEKERTLIADRGNEEKNWSQYFFESRMCCVSWKKSSIQQQIWNAVSNKDKRYIMVYKSVASGYENWKKEEHMKILTWQHRGRDPWSTEKRREIAREYFEGSLSIFYEYVLTEQTPSSIWTQIYLHSFCTISSDKIIFPLFWCH